MRTSLVFSILLLLLSALESNAGLRDGGGSSSARSAGWDLRHRLLTTNMQIQSVVYSEASGKALVFAGGEGLGFLGKNFVEILVCDIKEGSASPRKNDLISCVPLKMYENSEAKNRCIAGNIDQLAQDRGDQADVLLKQLSVLSGTIAAASLWSCRPQPPVGGTVARLGRLTGPAIGAVAALGATLFSVMRSTDQVSRGPQTYRSVEDFIAAMPEGNVRAARAASKEDIFSASRYVFDRFQDLLLESIDICQKVSGSKLSSR